MQNELTRRGAMMLGLGAVALTAMPRGAQALTTDQASALIGRVLDEINVVINSGKSEGAMFADFERIFSKYADVPIIARSALGVAARSASAGQLNAFTAAFRGYMARKYGRRFREIIGGRIEVTGAKPVKSFFEVSSIAYLRGREPFDVRWHVSDKSGKDLFFNLIIEGVNMLATERTEIGAMLDKRRGDIDALIGDLKRAG
ncbi:ABC transporter substrate-binding protein [Ostreiculturibacter nitratireducens]|uniref:MlaC/ttg2D family ABC transporter substrate-binding protein n=1 Tax=Ostreiculturibacter nitratireducens TaxID=3075226 RepID=UPI0031B63A76